MFIEESGQFRAPCDIVMGMENVMQIDEDGHGDGDRDGDGESIIQGAFCMVLKGVLGDEPMEYDEW